MVNRKLNSGVFHNVVCALLAMPSANMIASASLNPSPLRGVQWGRGGGEGVASAWIAAPLVGEEALPRLI